jgi:hypothetical protein
MLGEVTETMCDEDHRAPYTRLAQVPEELKLSCRVHRCAGLVHDDEFHAVVRYAQKRACRDESLPLTT